MNLQNQTATSSLEHEGRLSPAISIVVPVYNEESNIEHLIAAIRNATNLVALPYEIVLVNDGSRDGTWAEIERHAQVDPRLMGISLSRNFGHQHALFAGLCVARGQAIISMDGDLQHPPDLIPELVRQWQSGYKIVNTTRRYGPDIGWFKRTSSRIFYRVFSALSGVRIEEGSSDFRLIDRSVLDVFKVFQDADLFLRGVVHWVGFRSTSIPYTAAPRRYGVSKYNLKKMIAFATTAIVAFSSRPLIFGIWLGLITSALAFLELIFVLAQYLRGNTVPGWASVVGVTSLLFGILFFLLGIIGLYLIRIHRVLQSRPRFIIGESINRSAIDRNFG